MKVKIHLVNGEIVEINNVDKENLVDGIKYSHGDYATFESINHIIFLRKIMYIEMEE